MDNITESLNEINNKLSILSINNVKDIEKEDIFLIEKFENMNNEIKNISSKIKRKDFKCNTRINPYIIMFSLYIIFIIFYLLIN